MEAAAAANWGFHGVHLAITDHDEFAGSLALLCSRPNLNGRIALSEELSLWFQGHLFHLGVSHMPESRGNAYSNSSGCAERSDELFETLAASGCLVVLNHSLEQNDVAPATSFRRDDQAHLRLKVCVAGTNFGMTARRDRDHSFLRHGHRPTALLAKPGVQPRLAI
jgi:hypothetical protein